jgi:hypothetical protein
VRTRAVALSKIARAIQQETPGKVSGAFKLGAAGFESVERFLQACAQLAASVSAETADTQRRTQKLVELGEVIEAWPKLSPELRIALLVMTRTANKRCGYSRFAT